VLTVPATVEMARKLTRLSVKHNLKIDPRVSSLFQAIPRVTKLPGFNFTLKPYQAEGVAWLESQLGTGLLADEQGTGKTVTITAYAHKNKLFPMCVVLPNTLKLNWRNEIIAMTGSQYRVNVVGHSYSQRQTALRAQRHPNVIYSKTPTPGCDIYLVNYDILSANVEALEELGLKLLVLDESHKIKNSDARRTQAFLRLATGEVEEKLPGGKRVSRKVGKPVPRVVLMSGTPMVNRPAELWTTVRSLASYVPQFSTWAKFAWRFCNPVYNGHGWNFSGSSNMSELHQLLTQNLMLRRLKQDVLKELPPKVYRVIPLEFERAEYDRVERAFQGLDWKGGLETMIQMGANAPKSDERIVAIQKLREVAALSKLGSTVEWIRDYTENGEKLVVFAHNRAVIDHIRGALEADQEWGGKVGVIFGGVSNEERAEAVERFQQDSNTRVILVGITAGGFGLTLTAARAVAFVQTPWSPGEIQQCADRVHRIGQDADQVTIYNLVAENTIEELMADMLFSKGQVLDAGLDGGAVVNTVDLRAAG